MNAEVFGPFLSIVYRSIHLYMQPSMVVYIGRATPIYATIPRKIHHVFTGSPRVARVVCRVTGAIAPQPPRSDATTCMVDLQ